MRKLLIAALTALSFSSQAQVWTQVGNTLQRQTNGVYSNYRFNMGSPGFFSLYSKAQTDSVFNSGSGQYLPRFGTPKMRGTIVLDGDSSSTSIYGKNSLFFNKNTDGVLLYPFSTSVSPGNFLLRMDFSDNTQGQYGGLSLRYTDSGLGPITDTVYNEFGRFARDAFKFRNSHILSAQNITGYGLLYTNSTGKTQDGVLKIDSAALSNKYVPYSGAVGAVNLNSKNLTGVNMFVASTTQTNSLEIQAPAYKWSNPDNSKKDLATTDSSSYSVPNMIPMLIRNPAGITEANNFYSVKTDALAIAFRKYNATYYGGIFVPTTRQILNGYGITGGTTLSSDITKSVDSTQLQTIANLFPRADTRYIKSTGTPNTVLFYNNSGTLSTNTNLQFSSSSNMLMVMASGGTQIPLLAGNTGGVTGSASYGSSVINTIYAGTRTGNISRAPNRIAQVSLFFGATSRLNSGGLRAQITDTTGIGTADIILTNTNGTAEVEVMRITGATKAATLPGSIKSGGTGLGNGSLQVGGNSSGTVSINAQSAAGTYNFNLPTTAGTAGQVLTSQGGGATAMTWTTPDAASVASADLTGQSTALATVSSFTTTALGSYRVGGYLKIASVTTNVIKLQCTYTDQNGTSQTEDFYPQGATSPNLSTVGFYALPTKDIRVNSGGVITMKTIFTTSGGSISYDVGATITKLR